VPRALDVLRRLSAGFEAEHACVAEPEDGRHGADVVGAVRVRGADEADRCAPVEDRGEIPTC
jgi:hypothetical protein